MKLRFKKKAAFRMREREERERGTFRNEEKVRDKVFFWWKEAKVLLVVKLLGLLGEELVLFLFVQLHL